MAFESRLPSSWWSRVRSPMIGTASSHGSMVTMTPAMVAEICIASTASLARPARSSAVKATFRPRPAPGSASRSSASRWSCSALRSMVWSMRTWLSESSDEVSSSNSTKPRIEVTGVRSS